MLAKKLVGVVVGDAMGFAKDDGFHLSFGGVLCHKVKMKVVRCESGSIGKKGKRGSIYLVHVLDGESESTLTEAHYTVVVAPDCCSRSRKTRGEFG